MWMASVGLLVCGSGSDAVYTIYFTLGAECINDRFRQKVASLVQIAFVVGALFATLFYYLYADWLTTTIYCLVIPAVLCAIVATYFTKESPMYLIR
jgi:MFS family permease